jgi:diguanylate cyclase (GGDEF)-like protein
VTLTGGVGNRIITAMADASSGARARQVSRRLRQVGAVLPLLVFARPAWAQVPAAFQTGSGWVGAVLMVAVAVGIAVGGWRIAFFTRRLSTRGTAERVATGGQVEPATDADSVALLRATVAHQAAEITRYQGRLEEVLKELDVTSARLKETSFKDELTGLYNRRFFFVRLEEEISRYRRFNHPVAVVLLDLDGFKEVNDGQGHMIGDETLRDIGQILTSYSRRINVVARYGGDEFVVLLVETSKEGARLYAERIRQLISSHPYSHGMHVTASLGVASLPEDNAATAEDLVRIADKALYVAKRGGKNQVAGGPGSWQPTSSP